MNLSLLDTVTLGHGSHRLPQEGVCVMEALALAMGLPHSDVPPCTDRPLAGAFQRVNDWRGWRSDEERTEYLRPYLRRLGRLALDGRRAPMTAYGFAAADLAVREIAPRTLDARWPEHAARLRGLGMIVDRESARAGRVAGYAAHAAAAAAYAAYASAVADAYAAADAAAVAADAADAAAYAAYAAADAAYAYREMAGMLLDRLMDVCEAGKWALPEGWTRAPLTPDAPAAGEESE